MAQNRNPSLPCDGDGVCMVCKTKPSDEQSLTCKTCVTPWHVDCLSDRPGTLADTLQWECPDCCNISFDVPIPCVGQGSGDDLIGAIRAIESDKSLTDKEKAVKRQKLMSGRAGPSGDGANNEKVNRGNDVLGLLDGTISCSFCMQTPEMPVTTPCGHNFCLKCFQKWVGQGKRTCANCRHAIPSKMASNPRINAALVIAIRMSKMVKSNNTAGQNKVYHFMHNQNRPDKAFTTERAKKKGKANACSGKIFITCPPDYFGPITAEYDPTRNQGVLVGETWEGRMECRQWGTHLPHISGIAGQSRHGAQSVALSGGYKDDEDHGDWFLYTGSGGRDLSKNRRTNPDQSKEQVFEKMNAALKLSCLKGYPVRVVRSHKEKRSCFAPEDGVRYDGIYRIEKCWRKPGVQGFMMCRYLFVRCDNDPAPWASDEHGDIPRPLPVIKELKGATNIIERKETPFWDFDTERNSWIWKKPPPECKLQRDDTLDLEDGVQLKIVKRKSSANSVKEKLLKGFCCLLCRKVMVLPLTTPCAHNFCKGCLEAVFSGQSFVNQRNCEGRRTLRARKNIMKCPTCSNDISDFLQNPQVNREMMGVIESLQQSIAEENSESSEGADSANEKVGELAEGGNACNMDSEVEDQKIDKETTVEDNNNMISDINEDNFTIDDVKKDSLKVSVIEPLLSDNAAVPENVVKGRVGRPSKKRKAIDEDQDVLMDGKVKADGLKRAAKRAMAE